jgi:hypothetical protein
MSVAPSLGRRASVVALLAIGAAVAGLATRAGSLHATSASPTIAAVSSLEPSNAWLGKLKGKHRQFFDNPSVGGGIALVHVMNYYDTYNKAFGVKDADVKAVLTFYGATTFYALNDAVWAKYKLGEFLDATDPATGKPATANPWRAAPVILGMSLPAASIESLSARGATLILCNNALGIFAGLLAQKRGLDANAVYEDLKANILPGIDLVPGMVIAVEQAHRAGLSYHRQ